ncbi:hypothetical protein KGF56_003828 [Candida oxycetoniae]|uniref:Uncharacterized protein n=1 Tax=Candida oxycetoniae TaxID=497107 RepID=A0AAI9SUZ0_9ASCO|nr:uncharacterized protein KGF56_003828 [Candida oxycetoniae]KAI3403407.2 hypothetical protein KGF56_003828 [Candida oxycetoniae]
MHNNYQRLESSSRSLGSSSMHLPASPPQYDDIDDDSNIQSTVHESSSSSSSSAAAAAGGGGGGGGVYMEQFEIEDPAGIVQQSLLNRAQTASKKFANNIQTRIIHPISKMIDPIYEGYKFLQMQYEKSILKIGNPLVIKRLLYVLIMMLIVFGMSKYNTNDSVNGVSVGALSRGKFYDMEKLSNTIGRIIDAKSMKEHLEYFSSIPHISGSKGDIALARYIEQYMKNNGLHNVEINEFQSFINYPNKQETFLRLADGSFNANLYEKHNENMEYLAYNPNALNTVDTISSKFLYLHYGTTKDYENLKQQGIDPKGKIILIKYGGDVPEPNKIHLAETYGVKAVVFITPKFESMQGDVIQRENVGLTRMAPGDILTPGWSSEGGYVTRLSWDKSETTPKIPSIPISWNDGEALIQKLNMGFKFEDGFSSGDGNSPDLQLKVSNIDRPVHPIWNVVGSIDGREQGDKGIIIGMQRDSTCYGTIGTNTGIAVFLEMIKVFTSLQRRYQWTPSRSIYFASFDATEYNLAGSTEWIENQKQSLRKDGYLYVDISDLISGDDLHINMHPFLFKSVFKALFQVKAGDKTLLSLVERNKAENNFLEMKNYIPFINLVNIPSLEIKYKGRPYPRNSCYDNFQNFEESNIDKQMLKHAQMVELLSRIVFDFAESPLIPYDFKNLGNMLFSYVHDLEKYTETIIAPLTVKPIMHFDRLERAVKVLMDVGAKFHKWSEQWDEYLNQNGGLEPPVYSRTRWAWNDNMVDFNARFLIREVQPKRSGYRNMLFGMPFDASTTGGGEFEWNTFPFVRGYLSKQDFSSAQNEINRLAFAIEDAARNFLNLV